MVARKTKFCISIEKLQISFEGSQELGEDIQRGVTQALGTLMDTQARALAHDEQSPRVLKANSLPFDAAIESGGAQPAPTPVAEENGEKPKPVRTRRARGGPSVGELLQGLKEEGFFRQARTSAEVLTHLKDSKGHNPRQTTTLTVLQKMTQKGDLYRGSNSDGHYIYKDTPFDASPGSPSPAEQPAR